MITLKKLFKDKEKIRNTQITFERYRKPRGEIDILFIGLYILNGLLVFGYYISSGKFLNFSPIIMFILPAIMLIVELSVFKLYSRIKGKKEKLKEDKLTKEEKLTKLFFDSQKKELKQFVKENYDYLEILSKIEKIDDKIFLSIFFHLIKNSTREELIKNNENIRDYINNDFPHNYDDIKKQVLKIIEEKLKSKTKKSDTEIDKVFKKETKKIIKNI